MDNFKCLGNCQECAALRDGRVKSFCPTMMTQQRTFQMAQDIKSLKEMVEQLVSATALPNIPILPEMPISD